MERWIVFIHCKKEKEIYQVYYIYLCTQKLKRNLLPLFINCCWHRILERWIVFIHCCWHRMERWIVFYSLL